MKDENFNIQEQICVRRDLILFTVSSEGKLSYSEVSTFVDKVETTMGQYMSITTSLNKTIALTKKHGLYAKKNYNDKFTPM